MKHELSMTRRSWMCWASVGALGALSPSLTGWLPGLARARAAQAADVQANARGRRRPSCIVLWMNGGASQMDTFDMKPGHENGGPFREIATDVPGIRISEHLPRVARWMSQMALIRSMRGVEGDHGRAAFHLRTGYRPQGPIDYPPMGSLVAKELGAAEGLLPAFVSISPYRSGNSPYDGGFLGPRYAPFLLGEATQQGYETALSVPAIRAHAGIDGQHLSRRLSLRRRMEDSFRNALADDQEFRGEHRLSPVAVPLGHRAAYDQAVRLMGPDAARCFALDEEPDRLRDAYGRNLFGQSCLLARRLVERGVSFVEIGMGNLPGAGGTWDTHSRNFPTVRNLSQILDAGWASLMQDLRDKGLLENTLVIWMSEFGRTPRINGGLGRDHYPQAWSTVLAGGPVQGGQIVGRTSADGSTVEERPVSIRDFIATVCVSLGIDPRRQNLSNVGRPIRIADPNAEPIRGIIA